MSKAEIHKLLETNPFSVESIGPLETYVSNSDYDFEADHAIIKLYQFHPARCNKTIVAQILARALGRIPACDFTQHLYLIPESVQSADESISNLIAANDLLERAMFSEFWTRATGPLFDSAQTKKSIRAFIIDIIAKTYRAIKVSQFGELINFSGEELQSQIAELEAAGWKLTDGTLQIPSESNAVKPKPGAEHLQFEQFGRILTPLR